MYKRRRRIHEEVKRLRREKRKHDRMAEDHVDDLPGNLPLGDRSRAIVQVFREDDGTFRVSRTHKPGITGVSELQIRRIEDWNLAMSMARGIFDLGYRGVFEEKDEESGISHYVSYCMVGQKVRIINRSASLREASIYADFGQFMLSWFAKRNLRFNTPEIDQLVNKGEGGFSKLGVSLFELGDTDFEPGSLDIMTRLYRETKKWAGQSKATEESHEEWNVLQQINKFPAAAIVKTDLAFAEPQYTLGVTKGLFGNSKISYTETIDIITALYKLVLGLESQERRTLGSRAAHQLYKFREYMIRIGFCTGYTVMANILLSGLQSKSHQLTMCVGNMCEEVGAVVHSLFPYHVYKGVTQYQDESGLRICLHPPTMSTRVGHIYTTDVDTLPKGFRNADRNQYLIRRTWNLNRNPTLYDQCRMASADLLHHLLALQIKCRVHSGDLDTASLQMQQVLAIERCGQDPELSKVAASLCIRQSLTRHADRDILLDFRDAEKHMKKVMSLDPNDVDAVVDLTQIHLRIARLVGVSASQVISSQRTTTAPDSDEESSDSSSVNESTGKHIWTKSLQTRSDDQITLETFDIVEAFCKAHPDHPEGFRQRIRLFELQLLMTEEEEDAIPIRALVNESMFQVAQTSLGDISLLQEVVEASPEDIARVQLVADAIDCLTFDECPRMSVLVNRRLDGFSKALQLWSMLVNQSSNILDVLKETHSWWKTRYFDSTMDVRVDILDCELAQTMMAVGVKMNFISK